MPTTKSFVGQGWAGKQLFAVNTKIVIRPERDMTKAHTFR